MAKVIHTCTGCVPIDASIIEVYTRLIATEARANEAAEHAEAAAGKAPYIGENGNWWEWDSELEQFVDTGVPASGGGGSDPNAVRYTPQSLTPSQAEQARQNISAASTASVSAKQDTLVSGTNIKTVNNQSLLGSGNIVIEGGSGSDPDAVKYTEQSLTDAQKAQARTNIGAGTYSKPVTGIPASDIAPDVIQNCISVDDVLPIENVEEGLAAVVLRKTEQSLTAAEKAQVKVNLDIPDSMTTDAVPTQNSTNPVQSGGVFAALAGKTDPTPMASVQPQGGMLPNVFYDFGVLSSNTTFALDTVNVTANILNHYFWQFSTGSTVPTITFPSAITAWYGGSAPTISENKTYQVSVIDGLGVAAEF